MTTFWVAVIALGVAVWHEINRFPAAGRTINTLQEKVDGLENDNERLSNEIECLKVQMSSVEAHLERLRDPEYYTLLDAGDGPGLYELEKARGLVE